VANSFAFLQLLDTILNALKALNDNDFSETANIIPQPYSDYTEPDASFSPFNVPSVLVPPEVIEIDGIAGNSDEDIQVKKEEWPEFYLRLFDNDVSIYALTLDYLLRDIDARDR